MPRKKQAAANKTDKKAKDSAKQPANDKADQQAEQLAALEKENAALKDQLLRSVAELDNVRKRAQKELEDRSKYAVSSFSEDLLEVLENLYRAEASVSEEGVAADPNIQAMLQGIQMTKAELTRVFEKYGITRIHPQGELFNHDLHQAVSQVESDEPEGTVIQVMQAGYQLKERLIRPAMVVVSKKS